MEYPRTVTAVQSLILKYRPNYNYNRNSQSNRVSNQLMFAQRRKTGDDEGDGKEKEQRPRRNIYRITFNDCVEKVHYAGNNDCPTQSIRIQKNEAGEIFQQTPWWRITESIGERQRRFVQSHGGIPHQVMGWTTISWPHVMSNLNSRGPTNRLYQQQCEVGWFQHNSSGRYHTGCCIRGRNWWKLVPPWQLVDKQRIHQRKIPLKY